MRDLFIEEERESGRQISLLISNARIAEKAQLAFQFNDSIDPRLLQRALVSALGARCEQEGIIATTSDLRRAIDLAVMEDLDRLKDAMRQALAKRVVTRRVEIPLEQYWIDALAPTKKSGYGAFPDRLNREARSFAEFLDADTTGTVKWWLRNPENELWATRLILPSGRRFFPDFAVGIAGRSTPDWSPLSRSRTMVRLDDYIPIRTLKRFACVIANMARSSGASEREINGFARGTRKASIGSCRKINSGSQR